jgi:hypothetical protein
MFTGRTALEEASTLLEAEDHGDRKPPPVRDIVHEAEELAVRWLGMEQHHDGDDIKIAEHKGGAAVILLIDTQKSSNGSAYATRQFRLSRAQYKKLRQLCRSIE